MDRAMMVLRRILAILLAVVFVVLCPLAMAARLFAREVADPRFVPRLFDAADLYSLAYDHALDAALTDLVARGAVLGTAAGGVPVRLTFEEPERTVRAAKTLIEGLLPRTYVQREVEETLSETVPYFAGPEVACSIDWQSSERVLALPAALRAASAERSIGAMLSDDVLPALVRSQPDGAALERMGIFFTPEEVVADARRVVPAEWFQQRVLDTADAVTPYLAGRADGFEVKIPLDDRIAIVADVLKEKAARDHVIVRSILEAVRAPVTQAVGGAGFTRDDLARAADDVAETPRMTRESDAVVDAAMAYLSARTDELAHTVDLRAHRDAAAAALARLASPQNGHAGRARVARSLEQIVSRSVPEKITVTDADLHAALGPRISAVVEEVREWIRGGSVLTSEDVFQYVADPEQRAQLQRLVTLVRTGARWNQTDLEAQFDPLRLPGRIPDVIDWAWYLGETAFLLRRLSFLLVVLPLVAIGLLGARSWRGRLMWSGVVLVLVSSTSAVVLQAVSDWLVPPFCDWLTPHVAAALADRGLSATARLIESAEVPPRLVVALELVFGDASAVFRPWLLTGLLLCGLSFAAYARDRARRAARPGMT